jgi:transglutaminase-like putative cysteine protease
MLLEPTAPTSQTAHPAVYSSRLDPQRRTVRPIGVYALYGIAAAGEKLLAIDAIRGYLLQIDCMTDNTIVLNTTNVQPFIDATGLAVWEDTIWFAHENHVYWCRFGDFTPQHFVTLAYPADGVAVWQSTVYVTSQKSGYIQIYDRATARQITRLAAPGVGIENLTVRNEDLWVCDRTEQTVYCMDRATGDVRFSVLTPFDAPTGLTFYNHPRSGEELLYVCYAGEEAYIRDDPNSAENPYELTFRDRTFIHPLHVHYNAKDRYALSNGYLIEMSYVEEISLLEDVDVQAHQLTWRIALPAETDRQKVKQVEAIGIPFTEEIQEGQRVAVFQLGTLTPQSGYIFGWKALLEVRGIKYQLTPRDVEKMPPLSVEFQRRYLVDDDELAMDSPTITQAAEAAIGTETNILRKILKIRNYVYDRMSYGIKPHIDTPDVALDRGVGSCGEYVGILLALARLNGIACRTVGRYKCPPYADRQGVPLQPDFNHVWIEFYVPGFGWLPMESNVDDVIEGGPYPTRFFMGLPWYHAEMSKGISFEGVDTPDDSLDVSIGEMAINHVRFTILGELPSLNEE